MRTRTLVSLLLLAATGSTASAEHRRNPLAGQPAIRNKIEMRKLRFEITPQFLVSTNQDYKYAFGPGAMLQFHIFDWIAVGVQGAYTFNANTALEDEVRGKLVDADPSTYQYPGPQPLRRMHDEKVLAIDGLFSAFVTLTPFAGKFSLFSAAFASYDFYGVFGVGLVHFKQQRFGTPPRVDTPKHPDTSQGETLGDPNVEDASIYSGFKVGGMVGIGAHLYFTQWLGLNLELRDYIVGANQGGADVNGDRHLTSADEGVTNNIFFGIGITLMMPPKAKVTP
jgi:outer membrane beta-barrel protein